MNFKKYIESSNDEEALLDAIRSGDETAFYAYLDFLEENGREIPKELEVWRDIPNMTGMNVRWMLQMDMPQVLMIEKIGSKSPWSDDEFYRSLNSRSHRVVAECGERVLGYCIFRRDKVQRMVIHPLVRKEGVDYKISKELPRLWEEFRRYGQ